MAKDFLGRGWRFPVVPDATGALGYAELDDNVAQSVQLVLLTRVGERVMRGGFGSRIPELVFYPGSAGNLRAIERAAHEAIITWEPRVELLDVRAEQDPREPSRVEVSISYRVLRTNTKDSLVFPFYLSRAEAP